ncbi:hypothetical protein BH11PSE6_BH11PSE6_04850 [soil metagenome]
MTTKARKTKKTKGKKTKGKKTVPVLSIIAPETFDGVQPGDTRCRDGREWVFTIDMGWQLTGNAC